MTTVASSAASSITTTTSACDSSPKSSMAATRTSPASRHSQRQRKLHRQAQQQQTREQQHEEDEDEDDDLILCSPSRHSDRRQNQQNLRLLDPQLPSDRRPVSSRSHLRCWHRQSGRSRSPSSSKHLRPSSDGPLQPPSESSLPSMSMTKEEFEALPPTIQRKYFSTLERLRFANNTGGAGDSDQSLDAGHDFLDQSPSSTSLSEEDIRRPALKARFASDPLITAPHHRPRVHSSSARLYTSPPDKVPGRPLDSRDRHPTTSHSYHGSVILDATDEAFVKIGKRQSQLPKLDSSLHGSPSPQPQSPTMHDHGLVGDETPKSPELQATADSIYESFRWLEEEEDLDLRLCFDEYHLNLQSEGHKRGGRGPSFRRHLSITKLPFGRPVDPISRPDTKSAMASPALSGTSIPSLPSPGGHVRRRSRALSLISPNKTPMPDVSSVIDPAASHYQDPEARMKLRVYLASPHKFDEAIEFGFPSIHEVHDKENASHTRSLSHQEPSNSLARLHTSIDDEIASMSSDPISPTESSTPRTPESMDQSSMMRPLRADQDPAPLAKVDYAHAPASSREMTLRMTLTRPDLRADEEQIYGWQKATAGRKLPTRDGTLSPRPYTRGASSKDSIEKQFAAIDEENLANDNGVMKRFWNRVRRS